MSSVAPLAKVPPVAVRAPFARIVQRKAAPVDAELESPKGRCACGGGCPRCQANVLVGASNDRFEREADRAADTLSAVTGPILAPVVSPITPFVAPSSDGAVMRAGSDACASGAGSGLERRLELSAGRGAPLPESTRTRMEGGLGADFSAVQVHHDGEADSLSRGLGARAFTHRNDIYFRAGEYQPGTPSGDWLIAHELTHVVQQQAAGPSTPLPVQRAAGAMADAWDGVRNTVRAGATRVGEYVEAGVDSVLEAAGSVRDVAVDVAGTVGNVAADAARSAQALVERYLEANAPGVLAFLRGDLAGELKRRIYAGLDYLFDGLGARIRAEGLTETMREVFGEFTEGIAQIAGDLRNNDCESLFAALRMIGRFGERLTGPVFGAIRDKLGEWGELLGGLWTRFGQPGVNAIRSLAGSAWDWVTAQARWVWAQTEGVRNMFASAWAQFRRRFNLAWDSAGSLLEDLQRKATEAWEEVKRELGPWLLPLQVAVGVLLLLSPLGPVVAVGATGYAVWQAIGWIRAHWDEIGNAFVTACQFVHDHVLGPLVSDLERLRGGLSRAADFLGEQAGNLVQALGGLLDALGLSPMLRAARRVLGRIVSIARSAAQWLAREARRIFTRIGEIAAAVHRRVRPLYGLIAAIILFPQFPFLLPIVLTGWAWRLSPDCIKPPIIDFAIDVIAAGVRALPEFRNFGDAWPAAKAQFLQTLGRARAMPHPAKLRAADKVARMMTGEDVAWIGNLISAARGAPAEFPSQVEEELIGMDLAQPLPFERTAAPVAREALAGAVASGALSPSDAGLLSGRPLTSEDVTVDRVASTEFHPDMVQEAGLADRDGEVWLGEGGSPRGIEEVREEVAGGSGGPSVEAPGEDAPPAEESRSPVDDTEARLQSMMEPHQEGDECGARPDRSATATPERFPEAMKFGPLTQSQRARFLWSQLRQGMAQWWRCNRHWVIPVLILAAVALIGLEILTEGAITAALPPLMELLASLMIGIAAVRVTYYVGEYVARAIDGDTLNASKSLARGLAAAAIEVAFAVAFNLGAVIRTVRRGAQASVEALAQAARRVVTTTVEAAQALSRTARRGGTALLRNTRRLAGTAVRQGRLVLGGVRDGVARGARTIGELLQRLRRYRFRGFSLERHGHWFMLWGHFNPKILLADGRIEEISLAGTGRRPTLGMRATTKAGERGFIVAVRDTEDSAYLADLFKQSPAELAAFHRRLDRLNAAARHAEMAFASQTAEHARLLRSAMLGGGTRAGRGAPGAGNAAHHIVASTHPLAQRSRDILEEVGLHFNHRINGVFVPPDIHGPLHTTVYMEVVYDMLVRANRGPNPRAAVQRTLDEIAELILADRMPH